MNASLSLKIRHAIVCWGIVLILGMLAACGEGTPSPVSTSPTVIPVTPVEPTMTVVLPSLTVPPPPLETSTPGPATPPLLSPNPSPAPATLAPQVREISWEQAGSHVGETLVVCGPVVDGRYAAKSNGKPTFLNLGKKYPDPGRFTVIIWGDARDQFSSPPEELYLNHTICVSGEIEAYNGLVEIVVEDPAQIEVR